MSLTMDNIYQILDFLAANESCSLSLVADDVTISITKGNATPAVAAPAAPVIAAPAPVAAAAPAAAAPAADAPESAAAPAAASAPKADALSGEDAGLVPVVANVTSVFYRAPSPTEPPYVEVGDTVDEDTCVCLLEVMKCFSQTYAGTKGRVAKILANDGDVVEEGAVLFLIDPA